ncbi:endonuclease V [Sporosarcina sp. HYO08]|uniref:endonuclease V n=1 Tax=Sporosarcina sp. HYO08 TaxID=1759557 RepID=UPI00079B5D52|nr:endonuclease V [Sporosarcina sp. HYO08]KXH83759.1 endonuclease V [Sporosarcina sp. HYO08]
MEIHHIHSLDTDLDQFESIQLNLSKKVKLESKVGDQNIKLCAGVDVAYWNEQGKEWGTCCIVVVDYETMETVEKVIVKEEVKVPYLPGFLAFRELPLVIKAAEKLSITPDLFMFDGNGYLHPHHMGIATHASFFLNKPTIGIAKSYFKIDNKDFKMPRNTVGAYEEITHHNEVYGRALRTQTNVKPIFISCGNYIDLQKATEVTMHFINRESRLPIPVRLADLETKREKRAALGNESFH